MPKISQYPDGGVLQPTDSLVIARGNSNYRVYGDNKRIYIPWGVNSSISPMSTTSFPYVTTIDRNFRLIKLSVAALVLTTNDATNYWDITVNDSSNALVCSVTTASLTAGNYGLLSTTTFSIQDITASNIILYFTCTKNNAPGDLYLSGPLLLADQT